MNKLRAWLLRFGGLFRKQRRDRDFSAEMDSHLQMHIEDNRRAGMSPAEARRQALIKLGGIEQTKESVRDGRSLPILEMLLQDTRYGVRMLARIPASPLLSFSLLLSAWERTLPSSLWFMP